MCGYNPIPRRKMHLITAWMARCLYCLVAILLLSGTTPIKYSSQALVHAIPIVAHKQPLPTLYARQDPGHNALTASLSPASSTSAPSSTPTEVTVIQKPLIQIVAPNITLFAALDVVSIPSSSSSPSQTQYPTLPPLGPGDNSSHVPLLLPISSLSLQPNQIYHVDEAQMFGAGGSDPLTVKTMALWFFVVILYTPNSSCLPPTHTHY